MYWINPKGEMNQITCQCRKCYMPAVARYCIGFNKTMFWPQLSYMVTFHLPYTTLKMMAINAFLVPVFWNVTAVIISMYFIDYWNQHLIQLSWRLTAHKLWPVIGLFTYCHKHKHVSVWDNKALSWRLKLFRQLWTFKHYKYRKV